MRRVIAAVLCVAVIGVALSADAMTDADDGMTGLDYEEPIPNSRQHSVLGASINEGRRGGVLHVGGSIRIASGNRAGNSEDDEVEDDEIEIGEGNVQQSRKAPPPPPSPSPPSSPSSVTAANQATNQANQAVATAVAGAGNMQQQHSAQPPPSPAQPPPSPARDFDLSKQQDGSPIKPGSSKCAKWYKTDGPVKHGDNQKAAEKIMKKAEASRFTKHIDSNDKWAIGYKHGCTRVGPAKSDERKYICGCSEIWCPALDGSYLQHPDNKDTKCFSAKTIFGCYGIRVKKGDLNWFTDCLYPNDAAKNEAGAPIWDQIVF